MSKSLNIVFAGPNRVELREEPVPRLEPDEILCEARKSLISVGTETTCLRGQFDEGSNWKDWVRSPLPAGLQHGGSGDGGRRRRSRPEARRQNRGVGKAQAAVHPES